MTVAPRTTSIRPYGVAIQQAVVSGDLVKMKAIAEMASRWISEHGDISDALELLKIEIAILEQGET